jgi:hypothetical protein
MLCAHNSEKLELPGELKLNPLRLDFSVKIELNKYTVIKILISFEII